MQSPSLHFLHLSLQLKVFSLRFDYRRRLVKWALLRPAFAECKGGSTKFEKRGKCQLGLDCYHPSASHLAA